MGFLDKFRTSGDETALQQTMQAPRSVPGQPRFAVIDVETTGLSADQHRSRGVSCHSSSSLPTSVTSRRADAARSNEAISSTKVRLGDPLV